MRYSAIHASYKGYRKSLAPEDVASDVWMFCLKTSVKGPFVADLENGFVNIKNDQSNRVKKISVLDAFVLPPIGAFIQLTKDKTWWQVVEYRKKSIQLDQIFQSRRKTKEQEPARQRKPAPTEMVEKGKEDEQSR